MPIRWLTNELKFPPVGDAEPDGLLAVGGDLSIDRLRLAYQNGIFPWYSREPILWFSPDPRWVVFPGELKIPGSLQKIITKKIFKVTFNQAFANVIEACSLCHAHKGTWITAKMKEAYVALHKTGMASSVECWLDDKLVGGLYGVSVGGVFCGESMFHLEPNASKVALVALVEKMKSCGYVLLDSQVPTDHMARFGARFISRKRYLEILGEDIRPEKF